MLFRYPGGKRKIRDKIIRRILDYYEAEGYSHEFRVPFLGAGGIEFSLLSSEERVNKVWLNDYDAAIAAVWTAVMDHPQELCDKVSEFEPAIDYFYQYKEEILALDRSTDNVVDTAFKKIALHQISFSGLGPVAGGPIGGKGQKSIYDVSCRWNPESIRRDIKKVHKILASRQVRGNKCDSQDFETLITETGDAFLYMDPPYYLKGPELYQYSFSVKDHKRLARLLKETDHDWLLSYDDCGEIRKMYDWAPFVKIEMNYTINTSRMKDELLIASSPEVLNAIEDVPDIFE